MSKRESRNSHSRPSDAQPSDTIPTCNIKSDQCERKQLLCDPTPQTLMKRYNPIITTTTFSMLCMWSFPGPFLSKFCNSYEMGNKYPISQRSDTANHMPKIRNQNQIQKPNLNLTIPLIYRKYNTKTLSAKS